MKSSSCNLELKSIEVLRVGEKGEEEGRRKEGEAVL
jgi:hypothetical protein